MFKLYFSRLMFFIGFFMMWGAVGYLEAVKEATIMGFLVKFIIGLALCAPCYFGELMDRDESEM